MIQKYRTLIVYGALIVSLVVAVLPLTKPGFFPMHDDEQVGRLYQLDKAINSGHIPPRITPDLGFGFDYPLFNFYPPFVYYVAQLFVFLGFSYIVSLKLMIALGFILSALFMYLFARLYLNEIGSLVASVAYTYAPYHAVDVYVRGALPEFWSFVFVPALFWSITKLVQTRGARYIITTSLFIGCLILTHNLMAMMSGLFLGVYGLYLLSKTKHKVVFFGQSVLSIIFGFGLTAFFWIPSFFEKKYTLIDLLTQELANYNLHFIYIRQFFHSPWGYGGSLYGLLDGMSFELGKGHIFFAIVSMIIAGYFLLKKKKIPSIFLLFVGLFGASIFMQTFYSKPLWDILSPFWYIQFPWRFLMFSAFTMAFIIGWLFTAIENKKITMSIAVVAVGVMLALSIPKFQPSSYLTSVTDEDYTAPEVIQWRTSIMAFEYVPKGIATKKSDVGNTIIDITPSEIAKSSYEIVSGDVNVQEVQDDPHKKKWNVTARTNGVVQLMTFDFPGWKTFINGKEIPFHSDNKFKLITVDVPEGKYELTAVLADTPLRRASHGITLASAGFFVGFMLYNSAYRNRKKDDKKGTKKSHG